MGNSFFRLENSKFFAYPSTEPQNEFCSSLVLSTTNVLASYHHEIDPIWLEIGSIMTKNLLKIDFIRFHKKSVLVEVFWSFSLKMSVENWISNFDWIIFSLTNMNLNYTNDSYAFHSQHPWTFVVHFRRVNLCDLEESKINHFFISDCLPNDSQELPRCWWRMLETKYAVDNYKMLVTVLAILGNTIHYPFTLQSRFVKEIGFIVLGIF